MAYLISAIGILIGLSAVIVIRTILFKSSNAYTPLKLSEHSIDQDRIAGKLSEAIQFKTVSASDYSTVEWSEFRAYMDKLTVLFPLVHQHLDLKVVNEYSLVYKWTGKHRDKQPLLMTAHYDVVPVDEKQWEQPAFSGSIVNGYVWGRGSLDTKVTMISALEAAESLLAQGFMPEQDIYFAFGHDEEVGGRDGASAIAEFFEKEGITFEYLLDEGSCVIEGAISGIDKPLGLIGVGEKGYANIELSIEADSGHASMPPKSTSLGRLAKVICRLEKHQMKMHFTSTIKSFLLKIGPEMKGINKVILANLWLFKSLFMQVFSKSATGNALLRTTTAVTMAKGSLEPNVLPGKASCIVNFRLAIGETKESLISHIKATSKEEALEIHALRLEEASAISPINNKGYHILEAAIHAMYPDAIIAPYIILAGTDSRKYEKVCQNIYRFAPYRLKNEDLSGIHSSNEKISIENLVSCVRFYMTLFQN